MPIIYNTPLLLNAVSALGAGTAYQPGPKPWTVQATLGTTGVTTATVVIEVSNDLVGWLSLATITLSGSNATDGFANQAPWAYVRANVTSLGTPGTTTVSVALSS